METLVSKGDKRGETSSTKPVDVKRGRIDTRGVFCDHLAHETTRDGPECEPVMRMSKREPEARMARGGSYNGAHTRQIGTQADPRGWFDLLRQRKDFARPRLCASDLSHVLRCFGC